MIPRPVLAAWRKTVPWREDRQVEQDLLLSILALAVAQHPDTAEHLVWRGGTCLHKLHLDRPRRYSEDLDYVLVGGVAHGTIASALREITTDLGLSDDRCDVTATRINLWVSAPTETGPPITIKFEVNCADADPVLDLVCLDHVVDTRWWAGKAGILTFQPAELVGTKFRALAQRRKGRDLSDIWLARRELPIADAELAQAADHYLDHEGISPAELRARIAAHIRDPEFCHDLNVLAASSYEGFNPVDAGRDLIRWSDCHLDPLHDARRNPNAVRREQQRWEKEGGWAAGKVRCVQYEVRDGNLSRCGQWLGQDEECAGHPPERL